MRLRIATRVSRSGVSTSAMSPQVKRLRSRSSTPGSSAGSLSEVEHDLLVRVVERVEGVEELVLRAVLVRQELDVVDEQDVGRGPVARAELLHRAAAGRALLVHHRADEVGDELLAGDEADRPVGVLAMDLVPDRLQEVGLAETDAAVDEERVPARGRRLGDDAGRGVRELVGRADDELVEGVAARPARVAGRPGAGAGARVSLGATPSDAQARRARGCAVIGSSITSKSTVNGALGARSPDP